MENIRFRIRTLNAYLLYPIMKLTGFSFSKDYRWEVTRFHSLVYRYVDTVRANWLSHGKKMRLEMQQALNRLEDLNR